MLIGHDLGGYKSQQSTNIKHLEGCCPSVSLTCSLPKSARASLTNSCPSASTRLVNTECVDEVHDASQLGSRWGAEPCPNCSCCGVNICFGRCAAIFGPDFRVRRYRRETSDLVRARRRLSGLSQVTIPDYAGPNMVHYVVPPQFLVFVNIVRQNC